ncbi:MAG: hypothetical protein DMF52_05130 [Acidobacteria bacterium]|nr:MAG: hypothetical protein DMF52_05130 [Acidobacteriota bacterium]
MGRNVRLRLESRIVYVDLVHEMTEGLARRIWTHTSNPLDRENIFRTSGRGIFFMKHFVDRVEFQRRRGQGTEVVLEKKFEQAGRAGRGGEVIKRRKG